MSKVGVIFLYKFLGNKTREYYIPMDGKIQKDKIKNIVYMKIVYLSTLKYTLFFY